MKLPIILVAAIGLASCGANEVDPAGAWFNLSNETLTIQRGPDDELVAQFSNQYRVLIREHAFAGFSLAFDEGQNIMAGSMTGFLTTDGPQTFCRNCIVESNEDTGDTMMCEPRSIPIEMSGFEIDEAEFNCDWTRNGKPR